MNAYTYAIVRALSEHGLATEPELHDIRTLLEI